MSFKIVVPAGRDQTRGPEAPFHTLLGQVLLSESMITREHLREALCRQQEDRQPLGTILLQMGVLTPVQLDQALVVQARLRRIPWPSHTTIG